MKINHDFSLKSKPNSNPIKPGELWGGKKLSEGMEPQTIIDKTGYAEFF
ncbi:hypothetical protein ACFL1G_02360 [Planctomycetota bacterium]